jgi:hypothetical protein
MNQTNHPQQRQANPCAGRTARSVRVLRRRLKGLRNRPRSSRGYLRPLFAAVIDTENRAVAILTNPPLDRAAVRQPNRD